MSESSLYCSVMGDSFSRLAAPVRQFHSFKGCHEFHGEVQVEAPSSLPARVLAIFLGAPLCATRGPIRFELLTEQGTETWTRFFPGKTMRSTLAKAGSGMTERLGTTCLTFALLELGGALEMRLEKLHFLGVPCPVWMMPQVIARETGEARKLHFHIRASLPGIGLVTGYTGYLNMPGKEIR